MSRPPATALTEGPALLDDAVRYFLDSAQTVGQALLSRPTPCAGWDLGRLLCHVSDSLDDLAEGLVSATLKPLSARVTDPSALLGENLRARCDRLLAVSAAASAGRLITVSGHELTASLLTCTGAIEMAVHGWDIARACGARRTIPADLGSALLQIAPLLITSGGRAGLFAEPVSAPGLTAPGDRLVAFLGRDPGWPAGTDAR